jgi:O-antigen/teichoic acid export membrane protein
MKPPQNIQLEDSTEESAIKTQPHEHARKGFCDSPVRGRLLRGLGATAIGPIVTAVVQLVTIPLLLHAWGAAKYGDWLILSAIPSYLGLSDLGFGDASGSDMTMRVAAGDRKGAIETFQSSWVLLSVVSFCVGLLAAITVWRVPWHHWVKLATLSDARASAVVLVLAAYILVSQQCGILESGFRCDGNFATGTLGGTLLRIVEVAAGTSVGILTGSFVWAAAAYLISRIVGTIAYGVLLHKKSPWLSVGFSSAKWSRVKGLAAPAFGFMAFPVGYALSFQGLMLVVGARLGPVAVVSFSTLRTLSRLSYQAIGVIKLPLWPELSRAFGEGNIALARRLHRHVCQAALGLSVVGGSLLWIFGPFVYRLWIRHGVSFDARCFHVLLLVVVTNSLWDTSSVIPMSVNGHSRIALTYSIAAMLSLGVAWMIVPSLGTVGAAVALLATDGWMTCLVLRTALRHVDDNFKNFVTAMFTVPQLRRPTLQAAPEV